MDQNVLQAWVKSQKKYMELGILQGQDNKPRKL